MGVVKTVSHRQQQLNGMALGGLGTGSVEIMPNGSLEKWQIFNLGLWACSEPEKNGKSDIPDYDNNVLPFYIRTKQEGEQPALRKLCHDRRIEGFRNAPYSFLKYIDEIRWTPNFPVCDMEYLESSLPVEIKAEFLSPFAAHDLNLSATPGFIVDFKITNKTEKETEVSLLETFKNPINRGLQGRRLYSEVKKSKNATAVFMKSSSKEKNEQNGSMALSVCGGEHSYICCDFSKFFGAYVFEGDLGISEESCLFDFYSDGKLKSFDTHCFDESFLSICDDDFEKFIESELDEKINYVKSFASGYRVWKRINDVEPSLFESREGKIKFLKTVQMNYKRLYFDSENSYSDAALCSKITLQPYETKEICFTVSWYFPNHTSIKDNSHIGHRYNALYGDALEVSEYLSENREEIIKKVRTFSDTLQLCSAPAEFTKNWIFQLNTLIKCSWWAENGDFGIWEGLGSCGFHTMDITYYASYMLIALFPELQLRQMRMGLKFQRKDGRVHHFFRPDFGHVDDGYHRIDMNPQFVLMVLRDYLWTGDKAYLDEMWLPVCKAMDSIEILDSDGDGLPDTDTGANTYDAWKFRGIPTYIAGLWLAALTSAVNIADIIGDEPRKKHWNDILFKGRESFNKLWNGEYFSLWSDGDERDECLMTGQLDAAWYCKLMGIPIFVDDDRIREVMKQVFLHNYSENCGLVNASYPNGKRPTLYTYKNVQVQSNWTGVEFAISSMLLEMGFFEQARAVAGNTENRHEKLGRIFNHEECGEHYYRPLSAWTLMLSLSGLKVNVPKKKLSISTKQENLIIPWFTATGYGTIKNSKDKTVLECAEGFIEFNELYLFDKVIYEKSCKLSAGENLIVEHGGAV